jgi:hypothetical protein
MQLGVPVPGRDVQEVLHRESRLHGRAMQEVLHVRVRATHPSGSVQEEVPQHGC